MLDKKAISERLRAFGDKCFPKIKDFAFALDMKPSALQSGYLNGRSIPGPEILVKLKELGCDINWLLTGESDTFHYVPMEVAERTHKYDDRKRRAPVILGRIPAGKADFRMYYDEAIEEHPLDYDPDTHFWLQIDEHYGDSMKPLLREGDLVLVSITERVKDGDMVAVIYDKDKGAIKLWQNNEDDTGYVNLLSYNNQIPPMMKRKSEIQAFRIILIERKGSLVNR